MNLISRRSFAKDIQTPPGPLRVAVLDWDVHHDNGTQSSYAETHVPFCGPTVIDRGARLRRQQVKQLR